MIRLILGVSLFNAVAIFHLVPAALAYPSPVSSGVMESSAKAVNVLFQEASSASRELSLQCARQSKRVLPMTDGLDPYSSDHKTTSQVKAAVAQACPLPPFSFPLKVPPPSGSEGDPFLS
jgi:hypothetical protein